MARNDTTSGVEGEDRTEEALAEANDAADEKLEAIKRRVDEAVESAHAAPTAPRRS